MSKTQLSDVPPQLGYFLEYQFWENALDLLEYQLSLKPDNKHFNTLRNEDFIKPRTSLSISSISSRVYLILVPKHVLLRTLG